MMIVDFFSEYTKQELMVLADTYEFCFNRQTVSVFYTGEVKSKEYGRFNYEASEHKVSRGGVGFKLY